MRRAVILLSGGLDSATALAIARRDGFECHALTVAYGQRHQIELEAAAKTAVHQGAASHKLISVPLDSFGGSALTSDIAVPKDRQTWEMSSGIPVTYVPARNTVLLALALAYAETLGALDIYLGVNAVDYSGYPDCRPEFTAAFEDLANLATRAGAEGGRFHVHAPLMVLTKAGIIRIGLQLGVDYSMTTSCYDPDPEGVSCGRCDACQIRAQAFQEVGIDDPAQRR